MLEIMSGGFLGGFLGGATKGLESGLKYDAAFLRSFAWAIRGGHAQAANELVLIAEQNVGEMVDQAGNVLPNVVGGLLTGSDPFAGSRHQFQAWQAKWGVH